ncbi:hypothetical protein GLOTRDRAFT_68898 [Gloeophyllum trabeum ATCC 11539]|uniref:Elongator complex protein 4 n=1 Tax=Gloeophyllum trabeum (strain ATCC 11539 / FP-39264 / Madison 617) TaxID=670483 RepID=S7QN13_GLOTA|nr:uncharacterized protein GLOTRDRAFT_68898 [Gloeophyllum trabeum ATCC 11539]EPQ60883.1 hypothetical protein GLOTRDRAFT_68898 [Gloeophyllum trabeum ATCC 11539]
MSSFKRKSTSKHPTLSHGTRSSPSSATTVITSTGVPSLDDILGAGLPLSCSCAILASDSHSAYGELIAKYFIAQGLAVKQRTLVIGDGAKEFVSECMWTPGTSGSSSSIPSTPGNEDEEEKAGEDDNRVRIAWRYEQMKQFQTSVNTTNSSNGEFCSTFDLTARIPNQVVEAACLADELICIPVSHAGTSFAPRDILRDVLEALQSGKQAQATRICVPHLGSAEWGDLTQKEIIQFLYHLRRIVRHHIHACVLICPAPHICEDHWGGPGWVQKLAWVSDACVALSAFAGDPSMSALFPSHHGLVQIHSLPAPHTLLPPSDRFSTLRGVSASASSAGGVGENNLAFKCMRKRLIFETLHLDVEGGVGERRTTPAAVSSVVDSTSLGGSSVGPLAPTGTSRAGGDTAVVQVRLEGSRLPLKAENAPSTITDVHKPTAPPKAARAKKKVAFRSDAPDLYDF